LSDISDESNSREFVIVRYAVISLLLVFWGGCFSACDREQSVFHGTEIIAKVAGAEITGKDLQLYYQTLVSGGGQEKVLSGDIPESLKKALLERLINEKILLREAAKEGIRVNPDEVNRRVDIVLQDYGKSFNEHLALLHLTLKMWRAALCSDMMIEKLIKIHLSSADEVSDDEIRTYYQGHRDEFMLPRQYRLAQIVVPTEKMAVEIRDRLLGGESFVELARRYSVSPDGRQGGELGYWREDYLPAEFEGVQKLKIGEIAPVTHSPYGYHIVKLIGIRLARTIPLEEAGPEIAQKLRLERREKKRAEWMDGLKKKTTIIRYYDKLRLVKFAAS